MAGLFALRHRAGLFSLCHTVIARSVSDEAIQFNAARKKAGLPRSLWSLAMTLECLLVSPSPFCGEGRGGGNLISASRDFSQRHPSKDTLLNNKTFIL